LSLYHFKLFSRAQMLFRPASLSQRTPEAPARPDVPLSIAMMIETVGLGGAEMVVFQLAQSLRARGHRVHPVVPAGREGWLLDALRADDFNVHLYDLRRPVDSGFPARLGAMLAPLDIDVIHSHEFVMAVYGAAAARRLRRPHVITMHGNQTMTDRFRRRLALRWAFRRSAATVAVSKDTRRHLESSLGVREGIVQVIPNGIPEQRGDRTATRAALGIAPDELLLLSVGNLTPRKAHAVLLEALIQLDRRGENLRWRLAIAGEGPERLRLENTIREAGLAARVHLLGSRTDVPDLQAAADVFVLPSLWEGLPLAILEAMFGGNVVIASDISGIPEAIEHGTHGLLTPPGDAAALADALGTVLRDPVSRDRLAAAALERARSRFTIDAMTSAYERLYR
jgi:glycosyltransferase involved in cell wall biosynthesis